MRYRAFFTQEVNLLLPRAINHLHCQMELISTYSHIEFLNTMEITIHFIMLRELDCLYLGTTKLHGKVKAIHLL